MDIRVEGIDDSRRFFQLYQQDPELRVHEYEIKREADIEGLRILLNRQLLTSDFKVIDGEVNYSIVDWIIHRAVNKLDCIDIIYAYLNSLYIKFDNLDDNKRMFFLKFMLMRRNGYAYQIVNCSELYEGGDDSTIFHYGITLEDLIDMKVYTNMELNFRRDFILDYIDQRPDCELINLDE